MEHPNKISEVGISVKQAQAEQATQLKQSLLNSTSQQKQAELDPVASLQNDIATMDPNMFRLKYYNNPEALAAKTQGSSITATQEQQAAVQQQVADDYTILETAADSALAFGSGAANIVTGIPGAVMAVGAEPVEAVTGGLDAIGGALADFTGTREGYENLKTSADEVIGELSQSVDEFRGRVEEYTEGTVLGDLAALLHKGDEYRKGVLKDAAGLLFETGDATSEWIKSGQSDALEARTEIRAEENKEYAAKLSDELETEDGIWEHMVKNTKIGTRAAWELATDPQAATVMIAESAPSLLIAGKVAGDAAKASVAAETKRVTNLIGSKRQDLAPSQVQASVDKYMRYQADKINTQAQASGAVAAINTNAMLEASGTASEVYNTMMGTDLDKLKANSKRYNELLEEYSPEEARKQLALESSVGAGTGMLVAAYGISKATGVGEAANRIGGVQKTADGWVPKSVMLIKDAAAEGVEEAMQSFSSAVIGGNIEKENIDPTKDVYADAAIQSGEGVVAGVGTSAAINAGRNFSEAIVKGADIAGGAIQSQVTARNIRDNGVSDADLNIHNPQFDYIGVMRGVQARNKTEGLNEVERRENYEKAMNASTEMAARIESMETILTDGTNLSTTERTQLQERLEKDTASFEKGFGLTQALRQELINDFGDIPATVQEAVDGNTESVEQAVRILNSAPETISEEQAQTLLDSGSLNETQTNLFQAHVNLQKTQKQMSEVSNDIMSGGKGFVGAAQWLQGVSSSLALNDTSKAYANIQGLAKFSTRHNNKANDLQRALMIAKKGNEATSQEAAEHLAIQEQYKLQIHRNSDRLVEGVKQEANMLKDALAFGQAQMLNHIAPEATPVQTEATAPETTQEAPEAVTVGNQTVVNEQGQPVSATDTVTVPPAPQPQTQEQVEARLQEIEERNAELDQITERNNYTEDTLPEAIEIESAELYTEQQDLEAYLGELEAAPQQEVQQDELTTDTDTTVPDAPNVAETEVTTPQQGELFTENQPPLVSTTEATTETEAQTDMVINRKQGQLDLGTLADTLGVTTNPEGTDLLAAATPEARTKEFYEQNLVQEYFVPANTQGNPLATVDNAAQALEASPADFISNALNTDEVSAEQLTLADTIVRFDKAFAETLENTFVPTDTFRNRDMMQYLAVDGQLPANVVTAMSVAALNWVIADAGETLYNSDDDIRRILDMYEHDDVTAEMKEYLREGSFRNRTAESLGKDIIRAIGIRPAAHAPSNMQSQLANSLGLMTLRVLENQNYLSTEQIPNLITEGAPPMTKLVAASNRTDEGFLELHPVLEGIQAEAKGTGSMLSNLFSVENRQKGPTTTPSNQAPEKVDGTNQDVSPEMKDAIVKHQARYHFLKQEQVEHFMALSENTQLAMLGYVFDLSTLHERNRDGQEGANRDIRRGLNLMKDFVAEQDPTQPFYFEHVVLKNGRLRLNSNTFNPQGNKLHRHMILIEGQESIIDLNDTDPTNLNNFLIAFGQGMGVDVDKQLNSVTVAEVKKLLQEPVVQEAILAIQNIDGTPTPEQEAAILAGVQKGGEAAWSFDALTAYANFRTARANGDNLFTHDLMIEADGITNGPAIATLQFGVGSNLADVASRLEQVGINMHGNNQEFGEYISQPHNQDNYETIVAVMEKAVQEPENANDRVIQFAMAFLDLNRKLAKEPLMTTIYGAGEAALKSAMGNQMVDAIYSFIEKNQNNPANLEYLAEFLNYTFDLGVDKTVFNADPLNTTIPRQTEINIARQVGEKYGGLMVDAIDANYGEFKEKTAVINSAMEVLAEVFNDMYMERVQARTQELVDEGVLAATKNGPLEMLPQAEIDQILSDLIQSQPILQSVITAGDNTRTNEGIYVGKINQVVATGNSALFTRQNYANGSSQMYGSTTEYVSGGAAPVVLAVQNIDAITMMQHLVDNVSFNVYDAIITGTDKVSDHTVNINKHLHDITRDHSIPREALNAYTRAHTAAVAYDAEHGTNHAQRFVDAKVEFNEQEVAITEMLQTVLDTVNETKNATFGNISSVGQYGWEGSSYQVPGAAIQFPVIETMQNKNAITDEDIYAVMHGSDPEATAEPAPSDVEQQITAMNAVEVFESLADMGDIRETPEHQQVLVEGMTELATKISEPLKLHIGNVLGKSFGNIQGQDIYLYTQIFGGAPNSDAPINSGFHMSAQEVFAHEMWHGVSRNGIDTNSRAQKELNKLWERAKDTITVTDLMDDPTLPQDSEAYIEAQRRWRYLFEPRKTWESVSIDPITGKKRTKQYSQHLHEFAAHAMTNQKVMELLRTVPVRSDEKLIQLDTSGVDTFVNSVWQSIANLLSVVVNELSSHLTNTKGLTTDLAVQELVKQISNIEAQNKNLILSSIDAVESAAGKLSGVLGAATKKVARPIINLASSKLVRDAKQPVVRLAGRAVKVATNKELADFTFRAIDKTISDAGTGQQNIAQAMWNEAKGVTAGKEMFHSLLRIKKKSVDAAVVEVESNVAKFITKVLPEMTEAESTALTKVFLKGDMSTLNLTNAEMVTLLENDSEVTKRINGITNQLQGDQYFNHYDKQARALGYFMVTGRATSPKLNLNAKQIARLFGTGLQNPNAAKVEGLIDQLASLYALQYQGQEHKFAMAQFVKNAEAQGNLDGMQYLQEFHKNQKASDMAKLFQGNETNVIKGYVNEQFNPNVSAVMATESEGAQLVERGWVKYEGELPQDPDARQREPMFFYVNKHGGDTATVSGIMSLTSTQRRGTSLSDIRFMLENDPAAAGTQVYQDVQHLHVTKDARMNRFLSGKGFDPTVAANNLVPIYDTRGDIQGYRHMMTESVKDNVLDRNSDLVTTLSKGAGSSVNKINSQEMNDISIKAFKEQYDLDTDQTNYIGVGPRSIDPEIREIYAKLPEAAKRSIKEHWGGDTMLVNREVFMMTFGYRKFSVADALEKEENQKKLTNQALVGTLNFLAKPFGIGGTAALRTTGQVWQEYVGMAKDFLIIKSGIVTIMNAVSNSAQLFTSGMGIRDILKYQREAYVEATAYRKAQEEIYELEKRIELGVSPNDLRKYKSRVAQLKSEVSINPVAELVEDGLLQTIVDDVSLVEDTYSKSSKAAAKLRGYTQKLPGWVQKGSANVFMNHDTKSYKFMSQAAQLSDFVARYALYQHNTQSKGMAHDAAVNDAVATFINFDLPTNKLLQYANDMGLAWFTKYYIRVQKMLVKNLAENPARTLGLLIFNHLTGGSIPNVYDSAISPENIGNRIGLPDNPVDMVSNTALGQII